MEICLQTFLSLSKQDFQLEKIFCNSFLFFLQIKYIKLCIPRALQIVVYGMNKINIREVLSGTEIRYLMIALLIRACAVTPTLKHFYFPLNQCWNKYYSTQCMFYTIWEQIQLERQNNLAGRQEFSLISFTTDLHKRL